MRTAGGPIAPPARGLSGRRRLAGALALLGLAAAARLPVATAVAAGREQPPVVFVHGNGDSAALWITTLWRFESNGWDPALLLALDLPRPAARRLDSVPEENRSSTAEQAEALAEAVERTLRATGQPKAVLVGSSRAGNTIRNYIKNRGGAARVSLAILCGATSHGVFQSERMTDSEWNGRGRFVSALNAGTEVHPGVRFVTLRSDRLDKYAQPEAPAPPGAAGPGHQGPALAGARNVVLAGLDHREVAFHRRAFRELYRAIAGREPERLDALAEPAPLLDGMVSGYANGQPTNLPLAGATLEVYEVDPGTGERRGAAAHRRTTAADGRWGPFRASPTAYYEFVLRAAGMPALHVYRTPFPRSSRVVHFRLGEPPPEAASQGALVILSRPRGYLGHGRDTFTIDGRVPDGVSHGVPASSTASLGFPEQPPRPVRVVLNAEALTVRTRPPAEGRVVAEFHH